MSENETQSTTTFEDDMIDSIESPKSTFIEVRFGCDEIEQKIKIEVPLASDWDQLINIIGNSLGFNSGLINSLIMVGGKDGTRSPPLTNTLKFRSFFSYYNYEQADFFEIQLSKPLTSDVVKLPEEINTDNVTSVPIMEITSPVNNDASSLGYESDFVSFNDKSLLSKVISTEIDLKLPTPTVSTLNDSENTNKKPTMEINVQEVTIANDRDHSVEGTEVDILPSIDNKTNVQIADISQNYQESMILNDIISVSPGNTLIDSSQQSVQSSPLRSILNSSFQASAVAVSPDLDGEIKSTKVTLRCSYKTTSNSTDTNTNGCVFSDITVNRLCTWNELTATIMESIFQKTTKIHSFILVDSEGDELSGLLTTAEMFWKAYQKNRLNKEETSFQIDYTIIPTIADEVKKVAQEDMKEIAKAKARKKIESDIRQRALEREKEKNSPSKGSPIASPSINTSTITNMKATITPNGKYDTNNVNGINGNNNYNSSPLMRTPPSKINSQVNAPVGTTILTPTLLTTTTSSPALTAKEKIAEDIRQRALQRGKERQKKLNDIAALSTEKETTDISSPTSILVTTTTSITSATTITPITITDTPIKPSTTTTIVNSTLNDHIIDDDNNISPISINETDPIEISKSINTNNLFTTTLLSPSVINELIIPSSNLDNTNQINNSSVTSDSNDNNNINNDNNNKVDADILITKHNDEATEISGVSNQVVIQELNQDQIDIITSTIDTIESTSVVNNLITVQEIEEKQQEQLVDNKDTSITIYDSNILSEEEKDAEKEVEKEDLIESIDLTTNSISTYQVTLEAISTNIAITTISDCSNFLSEESNAITTTTSTICINETNVIEEEVVVEEEVVEVEEVVDNIDIKEEIPNTLEVLTIDDTQLLAVKSVHDQEEVNSYEVDKDENEVKENNDNVLNNNSELVKDVTIKSTSSSSSSSLPLIIDMHSSYVDNSNLNTTTDDATTTTTIEDDSPSHNYFLDVSTTSSSSSGSSNTNKFIENLKDDVNNNNNNNIIELNEQTIESISNNIAHNQSSISNNNDNIHPSSTPKEHSFLFYLNDDKASEKNVLVSTTMTWNELIELLTTSFSLATSDNHNNDNKMDNNISHLVLQDLDYDDVSPQLRNMEKFLKFIKKYRSGEGIKIQVNCVTGNTSTVNEVLTSTTPVIESTTIDTIISSNLNKNDSSIEDTIYLTLGSSEVEVAIAGGVAGMMNEISSVTTNNSEHLSSITNTLLSLEDVIIMKSNFLKACSEGDLALATDLYQLGKDYEILDTMDDKAMTALHYACDGMHTDLALFLIECGANIYLEDGSGLTPLHCICLQGLMALSHLLTPDTSTLKSSSGLTLLHCASNGGHVDLLLHLLKYDNNVHNKDKEGLTPLHHACLNGHLPVAKILVDNNASINSRDIAGMSPLLYACSEGRLAVVNWLIEVGANIHAKNNFGDGALHIASQGGFKELVQLLLASGHMKKEDKNNNNETAVDVARSRSHFEIADLISQFGAISLVDVTVLNTITPISSLSAAEVVAIDYSKDTITNNIPEVIVDVTHTVTEVTTASPISASLRDKGMITSISSAGANKTIEIQQQTSKIISSTVNYNPTLSAAERNVFRLLDVENCQLTSDTTPNESSPVTLSDKELLFRYACYQGDTLKIEAMIAEGMNVNSSNINGTKPLHYACAGGHFDTAYLLVHHGAKLNHSNHDGCTALHFSCYFQHDDISIWLLEKGSNINIKNKHGHTPLYFIYSLNQIHLLRIIMNDLKGVVPLEFDRNKSLLHFIVQFNYKDMVTLVIQSGYGNATSVDDELCTPLHYACQYGQLEIVQYLILNYGASINNKDRLGNNALLKACASGNISLLEWLTEQGASLQDTDNNGNTCLHVAAKAGKGDTVRWLLEQQKMNSNLNNNDGYTAGDVAHQLGFQEISSILPITITVPEKDVNLTSTFVPLPPIVEEEVEIDDEFVGAEARQEDSEDNSDPFVQFKLLCLEGEMGDVIHAIQVNGVDPNITNKKGSSALHFLSLSGNLKLCRKLVELGAIPNKINDRGLTPLLCACINGHLAVVKWLAQQPEVALTDISEDGRSALHHGCYNGHVNITEWLLKENIDVNIYSREGNLAFHDACIAGHVPVISSLINYGMNVSTINQYGFSPITLAMEQGHLEVVKILVINGADVNVTDNHNRTIFLYACGKGYLEFAQWLVRTSKEVNIRAVGGVSDKLNTGLHTAVKYGHLDMIKWLLEIGLDVNAVNEKQQTPIAIANAYQYFEISKLLILKRFSVFEDLRNFSRFAEFQVALKTMNIPIMNEIIGEFAMKIKAVFNLIHYAAATGNIILLNLLIERKEFVNCKTNLGHTPLHYAAVKDHTMTAKKLMEFGADLEERDLEGCTPLVLAMYAGNAEVSKLLFNTRKKEVFDITSLVENMTSADNKKSTKNNKSTKAVKNPILRALAFAKSPMKGCTTEDDNDLETTSVLSIFSCITSRSIKEDSSLSPLSALPTAFATSPLSPEPPKQQKHLTDSTLTTPHAMAIKATHRHTKKLFEVIPEEGGGIDVFDFSGPPLTQAMITACQCNDMESLQHFVSQGVNVNLRNPSNASTFLHFASMRGHLSVVEYLIEQGASVNLRNIAGMSPLHIACERKNSEMILLLVRHGADVMTRNRTGETPLHCLCARGLADVFREVLSIATSEEYIYRDKVKIEVTTNKGLTLLHTAVEYGAIDVVIFLLSLQVEVNPVDDENRAPIHFACLKGNLPITELLWDRGAQINARDTKGRTPFLYACVGGHLALMEWLSERGGDSNAMTDAGNNALHAACRLGDLDMVQWLVRKGVDPYHPNRQNVTPKQCALEAGKLDVIHWIENENVSLPVGQE